MKAGAFIFAASALLQSAVAQPHGNRQVHQHHRREADGVVVTKYDFVTVDAESVVVYVDEHGKPVYTSTVYAHQPAPTSASLSASSSSSSSASVSVSSASSSFASSSSSSSTTPGTTSNSATPTPTPTSTSSSTPPPPPSSTSTPPPSPTTTSIPPPPPSSTSAAASPSVAPVAQKVQSSSGGAGFGNGVTYSPYNSDQTCKTQSQVAQDVAMLTGYDVIRLYGTDCDQVANVVSALSGTSTRIVAGLFDLNSVADEVSTLSDAVDGNWDIIHTVSVGNEAVSKGASVGQVTGAVSQARSALRTAGFKGPVVTVDTCMVVLANIALCEASDYCAMNCHPFFDPNTSASGAGDFVLDYVQKVSSAAGGKMTVVTETGWPHKGDPNGDAVPSPENQQTAISSLQSAFSSNMILFSTFDRPWAADFQGSYNAEKFWGFKGKCPSD
ncbi:hypothetical protein MMC25_005838 [Agyrium rufum]|nr:hypothetical protein [Agyrium rufum]